jgi:membrane-associated phospholipid phosphatase
MTRSQEHTHDALPIAPAPTRRRRAAMFQTYVLIASLFFVVLAALAHFHAYFPIDLTITRALQRNQAPFFAALMYGLSWLGFLPQVFYLGLATIVAMFIAGLRWEALAASFAGGVSALVVLVKLIVYRPRPSADLVHVLNQLLSPSFPSGHVTQFTAFCGFLLFLTYSLLKPSPVRVVLMVVLGSIVALMGPSRIYLGQHWFSDVMGAYVLGSLWLVLTIKLYRWGKPRFFTRQPVAPEAQAARGD